MGGGRGTFVMAGVGGERTGIVYIYNPTTTKWKCNFVTGKGFIAVKLDNPYLTVPFGRNNTAFGALECDT